METDQITSRIIGAAIGVHRRLGPGLLESVYESCLASELARCGLRVERQKALPVAYDDQVLEPGYRLDLLVEHAVVVEIKAVAHLEPVHEAQMLTYLKLSGATVGLLINFNVPLLKDGITRLVRGFEDAQSRRPRSGRPRRPRR